MDREEISRQLGITYIHPTVLNFENVLREINTSKVIRLKEIDSYSGRYTDVSALLIDIEKAIYETLLDGEDYREAFRTVIEDITSLLPIGCITLPRPSLNDLNTWLRHIDNNMGFSLVFTMLFMQPNGEIWGYWDDGIYLLSRSIPDLLYGFAYGGSEPTYLASYPAAD